MRGRALPEDERLRELLVRARGGDRSAFDELAEAMRPRIKAMGWVAPYLQPRVDGSDIAQEVLMRIWTALPEFRGSGIPQFFAWVKRTASNTLTDRHEYDHADKRDARRDGGEWPEHLPHGDAGPADLAGQNDFWRCIADCLPRLTAKQREVVELILFKRMTYEEAARVLGKNRGTVFSRLQAALPLLRHCLGEVSP